MSPALSSLLTELLVRGVALSVRRGELKFACPPGAMTPALRRRVAGARDELLAVMGHCPRCVRQLDRGRCWRCHWRACSVCGRDTASAFIELCLCCDLGGRG